MKTVLRALLVVALTLGLAGSAVAEDEQDLRSTSVFPPDSPLFGLQHVLDAWEELLAVDPLDKAMVHAKVADNRLAETAAMLQANRADVAADLSAQMAELVEKAAARLEEAKADADKRSDAEKADKADRMAKVVNRLKANAARQQATLQKVLAKVENPKAQEAIKRAMERTAFGLENAQRRLGGERGPATPPGRESAPTRPEAAPSAPGRPAGPPASPGRP